MNDDVSGHDNVDVATSLAAGPQTTRGIGFPRVYDVLLFLLTRGRDRAYREHLLDIARIGPGDRVLDIGCGTGTQAIAAQRRSQPGGAVTGVDVAAAMVETARRKARRAGLGIAFRQADAADLPFGDGGYDVVTMTTVLHMVPARRRFACLAEARRVLRPGGRLVLVDYGGDLRDRRHLSARHGWHGLFDLCGMRDALTEADFAEIEGGPLGWLSLHFLHAIKR
jgi:SAM-dependent methyltransferase